MFDRGLRRKQQQKKQKYFSFERQLERYLPVSRAPGARDVNYITITSFPVFRSFICKENAKFLKHFSIFIISLF